MKASKLLQQPHYVFLIVGLMFGLFHLFFVPAFMEPDETTHFSRVYQIVSGHPLGQTLPGGGKGSNLPKALIDFSRINDHMPFNNAPPSLTSSTVSINNTNKPTLQHFENTELDNPVAYSPQIITVGLAKLMNFSLAKTFYFCRLMGLICWLLVSAYAIKILGRIGWAASILILTPMSIQIASSVTADSFSFAISLLFIALLIDKLRHPTPFSKKQVLVFSLVIVLLACVKLPYVGLGLLLILLPASVFGVIGKWRCLTALGAVSILIVIAWNITAQHGYIPYRTYATGINIVQKSQERYLITHPLSFGGKLYTTYFRDTPYTASPIYGYAGELGLLTYSVVSWGVALYFATVGSVFVALRSNNAKYYLNKWARAYSLAVVGFLFLITNILVFISWSRISIPAIEGIQSRYFIPLTFPLLLVFLPVLKREQGRKSLTFVSFVTVSIVLIQIAGALAVYYHYYVPPLPA